MKGKTPASILPRCSAALLLVDFLNPLEFPGASRLLRPALAAARHTAVLKQRARKAGIPVIYANDNFGRWQSSQEKLLRHCLEGKVRGRPLAELLAPEEDDHVVLKPRHSVFYGTPLASLLEDLGTRRIILTGISAESCVLTTAQDAHMREFELWAPRDCLASAYPARKQAALLIMRTTLDADVSPSAALDLRRLLRR